MLKLHPLVIASLFCGAPVSAEIFPIEIDEIFSWTDPQSPGCSVAVQRSDGTILEKGYGSADL